MRELLYRGKRLDNGEWIVSGSLRQWENGSVGLMTEYGMFKIDPETVGQYTGLNDEKDNKIFEGDIVTFKTFTQKLKAEVIYKGGEYWCKSKCGKELLSIVVENCKKDWELHCEIIGNIYDSPELLEVKE